MSASQSNKNTVLATNQKAIQGVEKHFAKVKKLTIAGVDYTPATLKAAFQAETDATTALDQSRAQMTEQVATTRAASAKANAARKGLRAYILGNYGAQAVGVLEDFGMNPPKVPGPKTVATKAEAIVKGKATRAARNTMGKKQRLKVKGDPATVAATQPAEATTAPPATVAAPAAAATPSSS